MECVNTFSEFNRLSIKNKFSPLLRAWYLLRRYNSECYNGSGWVHKEDVFNILELLTKKNRAHEIYKKGLGSWWEESGDGIIIFGRKKIARILNHLPGHKVQIPINAFSSLLTFKAFIYSTFFARSSSIYCKYGGKNISREVLTEQFGISDTTQKRYEDIASIEVENQYAYKKIPRYDPETKTYIRQYAAINRIKEDMKPNSWLRDVDGDGYQETEEQISNNYKTEKVIYISNENWRVKRVGGDAKREVAKPARHTRLYFDNEKPLNAMKKKSHRRKTGYLLNKRLSKKKRGNYYEIR